MAQTDPYQPLHISAVQMVQDLDPGFFKVRMQSPCLDKQSIFWGVTGQMIPTLRHPWGRGAESQVHFMPCFAAFVACLGCKRLVLSGLMGSHLYQFVDAICSLNHVKPNHHPCYHAWPRTYDSRETNDPYASQRTKPLAEFASFSKVVALPEGNKRLAEKMMSLATYQLLPFGVTWLDNP